MGSLLKDSVVSFFKIMIDHDFLNVLYLPPKFVRATPGLLNRKVYLENLNGRRWNVVVSEENGSLAFRKGWSEFSMAHNLGIGDFVVFHYFLGQYFVVQVFNKTACDLRGMMLGNSYPSSRTKSRAETKSVDSDSFLQEANAQSCSQEASPGVGDSNGSVISASEKVNGHTSENKNNTEVHPFAIVPVEDGKVEPTCFEDPELQLIMNRRDTLNEQRGERTVIDLSNYEMPSTDVRSNVVNCKVESDMEFINPKQEIKCRVKFSESAEQKDNEGSLNSHVKKKKYDALQVGSPSWTTLSPQYECGVKKKKYDVLTIGSPSKTALSPKYESNVKKKYDAPVIGSRSATPLSPKYESDVKKNKKCDTPAIRSPSLTALSPLFESDIKNKKYDKPTIGSPSVTDLSLDDESGVLNLTAPSSAIKIKKEVKTEPFEETSLALVTASASDLHCPIKNATAMFLELPGYLPLFTFWSGTSSQKLVLLRDEAKNIWPVLYHHKPSMKLTTGWPAFVKANNIQPGDECIFKADPNEDATYDVSIIRQRDKTT